ncbi:hypothetical protein EGJ71_20025, partial [Stutzerimonas stutzeri]
GLGANEYLDGILWRLWSVAAGGSIWPIAAGDDWQLPGQSGVSVHVLQHGAGSSSRLAEHS